MSISNNGFLQLDNALIDYWMSRLTHSEFNTLLVIYRKTIGWGKTIDRISQVQIAKIAGITTRSVRTAIESLQKKQLIVTSGKGTSTRSFALNISKITDVDMTPDDVKEVEKQLEKLSLDSKFKSTNPKETSQDFGKNDLHKRHSKDTNKIKEKDTAEPNISFDSFWSRYDYNKGKKSDIKVMWLLLSDEERTAIIKHLESYIVSTADKTYRKYPKNYLEERVWEQETISVSEGKADTPTMISEAQDNDDLPPCFNTQQESYPHWSELKAQGKLKSQFNPDAVAPDSKVSKSIDDFLSKYGSKGRKNSAA